MFELICFCLMLPQKNGEICWCSQFENGCTRERAVQCCSWDAGIAKIANALELDPKKVLSKLRAFSASAAAEAVARGQKDSPTAMRQRIRGAFRIVITETFADFTRETLCEGAVSETP
jgi:hypothetical protein